MQYGAMYIAKENEEAKTQVPTSTTQQTKPKQGKRAPAFNKGTGFVFSPVKTGPTSGVAKKTKIFLKPNTINHVKRAMPTQSQAVPTDPPGPTNPSDFEVLQNLCKGNSLSVFRHSDPQPTVQVPLSEVPQDNLGFAAMDSLLASGIPFTRVSTGTIDRDPLPEVP